jgi:hypothetical protein
MPFRRMKYIILNITQITQIRKLPNHSAVKRSHLWYINIPLLFIRDICLKPLVNNLVMHYLDKHINHRDKDYRNPLTLRLPNLFLNFSTSYM